MESQPSSNSFTLLHTSAEVSFLLSDDLVISVVVCRFHCRKTGVRGTVFKERRFQVGTEYKDRTLIPLKKEQEESTSMN
jgi:hypothetical protein